MNRIYLLKGFGQVWAHTGETFKLNELNVLSWASATCVVLLSHRGE